MNGQSDGQAKARRRTKHAGKHRGDGLVANAQHDTDVIQLVSSELDKRSATLQEMIAEAAYFRAEKRGFEIGHELEDWFAAEEEVVQRLQQQESKTQVAESRSSS